MMFIGSCSTLLIDNGDGKPIGTVVFGGVGEEFLFGSGFAFHVPGLALIVGDVEVEFADFGPALGVEADGDLKRLLFHVPNVRLRRPGRQ